MKTPIAVATLMGVSIILGWGCSTVDERLGVVVPPTAPPAFVAVDAGPDAEPGLTAYCATNKCPPGRVTCPGSRFPCDVDLGTDGNNCGACGHVCPTGGGLDTFVCIEGACALACGRERLDCDGLSDNGCETNIIDANHCGKCGNQCTDPDRPCMYQDPQRTTVACGCPVGQTYCSGVCVNLKENDSHCGACGVSCGSGGVDASVAPNVGYGCVGGTCGSKCKAQFANCNGPIEEGCDTNIYTDDNCGGCGNVCPADQHCRVNAETNFPECMCEPGLTFCQQRCAGSICTGQCVDVTSDLGNCGACGASCGDILGNSRCSYGACVHECPKGTEDCNNSLADGCEVDTDGDPRNCGGCGRACDAVAGQACVAGRCVVEPCSDGDAGGIAR